MTSTTLQLSYPVFVDDHIARPLADLLNQLRFSQLFVLCDNNTHTYCYPLIAAALPAHHCICIPAGEEHKNLEICIYIWQQLTQAAADRQAILINLGGGVIGDIGGFCAATYKRGIRFIQCPTTLLAQIDASIGGKVGVDFQGYKNHLGCFQPPTAVFIGTIFLETLSQRQLLAGFAEHIKHLLIADSSAWYMLATPPCFEQAILKQLIIQSLSIKAKIVEQDPHEQGLRKALNLGHTIGHAIESYFLEQHTPILHGEAVAMGIIAEAWLSSQYTGLPRQDLLLIQKRILQTYTLQPLPEHAIDHILHFCLQDKKNDQQQLRFSLLESIGKPRIDVNVNMEAAREALFYLCKQLQTQYA